MSFLDHYKLHEINFEALFPLEVDDEQIFEHEIRPVSSTLSPPCARILDTVAKSVPFTLAAGFNLHSLVFFKSARLAIGPGHCDWEHQVPPETRLRQLRQLLDEIHYMLDDIPGPMRQWASWGDDPSPKLCDSPSITESDGWGSPNTAAGTDDDSYKKLAAQFRIMRANLHGTHLWVQSALLDRIDVTLHEQAHRLGTESNHDALTASLKASWAEREDVCRQTLHLLHSIPYAYQEPNGLYFVSRLLWSWMMTKINS